MGVADVQPDGDNSVRVISATLSNPDRTRKLVYTGKAPVFPGNKIALASDLDEKGAQLMDATFQETRSITDLSINLSFTYSVQFPAARGYIKEDWSKLDSLHLLDSALYTKSEHEDKDYGEKALNATVGAIVGGPIGAAIGWFASGNNKEEYFTYDEMHDLYQFLEEKEVIEMHFEENLDDERVATIRDAYFQYFLNSFAEKDDVPVTPGKREIKDIPDIKVGNSYKFKREFSETILQKRTRVFNLNYKTAVTRSFQLTENLASWYDGVKDNEKCVGVVNLNDPFFKKRDVNVILDLDAEDMMGKEINYVTVSLRKQRDMEGANDFSHQLTIDRTYFTENGNRMTVTYSKAQDEDPDVYEYKVQWSLRGGNIYPAHDTTWTKGNWQGVTLAPPVEAIPIRFEADLEELKALDIRNATLQLRYKKFGKEVESNVNLSQYSEQPFTEKIIYKDKDSQGYAYRLVFTHKQKGLLAMPWESKVNTNYVYTVIPEELRQQDETFISQAIEDGKKIMGGSGDNEVNSEDQVLSKFDELVSTDQ